jgi:periplasmic divalent cation tolerance protein
MQTEYVVVLITAPSLEVGEKISSVLLARKLAACVNIIPSIQSLYTWQGELQNDQEVLLVVKTRVELFDEYLVPAVKALHPYEIPEIIALPIVLGSQGYLDWIAAETKSDS